MIRRLILINIISIVSAFTGAYSFHLQGILLKHTHHFQSDLYSHFIFELSYSPDKQDLNSGFSQKLRSSGDPPVFGMPYDFKKKV